MKINKWIEPIPWESFNSPITLFLRFVRAAEWLNPIMACRLEARKNMAKRSIEFDDLRFLGGKVTVKFEFDGK